MLEFSSLTYLNIKTKSEVKVFSYFEPEISKLKTDVS